MRPDEATSLKAAARYARRDVKTVRRWCRQFGVCRQVVPGGPVEISRPGLEMVLAGDMEALERLRSGDRAHPSVARYYDFLGLVV